MLATTPLRLFVLYAFVKAVAEAIFNEVYPLDDRQVTNGTSLSATFSLPPIATSTQTFDVSAIPTPLANRTDFSNDALVNLWYQIGPVSIGPITTTVSPTPEPTVYPKPDQFHPLVPSYDASLADLKLPENFQWGLASSAYQIEGAAKEEGKGPSIWDFLSHRPPGTVSDNTTGDVVASHYWLYKQDIARLKVLGIPRFSPSISWPRIFPFGRGPVNAAGVAHYDDVIREMVEQGIKPVITLYHWDTPLALHTDYGAWNSPLMIDDFVNYAKFVISRYDAYVEDWFTVNEPQFCNWQFSVYPAGEYYPAYSNITGGPRARFLCGHHVLLAHARIAKWYHNEFHGRGRITFKNSGNYFEARNSSATNREATQRQYDFTLGWFGGPWQDDGDYPQSLKDTLGELLPVFTDEEKELIKGSCDFYAIDPYTGRYAFEISGGLEACVSNSSHPGWPECSGSSILQPNGFPAGPAADPGVNWLYSTPSGVRRFLRTITQDLFPRIPSIVVSEFGFAEPFESSFTSLQDVLWDLRRADYIQSFLDNILLSIHEDGVNVTGAWGWAVFDNMEWFSGTKVRFGLQYVDYETLERTPKASMWQFLEWFGRHEGGNGTVVG